VLGTEQVPGLLAFMLWTFVSGFALVGRSRTAHAGHATAPAAATPVS